MPQRAVGSKRALTPGIVNLANRRCGRELLAEHAEPRGHERVAVALVKAVLLSERSPRHVI